MDAKPDYHTAIGDAQLDADIGNALSYWAALHTFSDFDNHLAPTYYYQPAAVRYFTAAYCITYPIIHRYYDPDGD